LLIDQDFQTRLNTPPELAGLILKLYEKRKGDTQPVYEIIMREYQKTSQLENFIGEATRLLDKLFSDDQLEADLVSAISLILDDFQKDRSFSKSHAELCEQDISNVFFVLQGSLDHDSARQALAVFLYTLILFDVVFLDESVASVTQFTMERFGDKAEQYWSLTSKIEVMRNALIYLLTEKDPRSQGQMVEEVTEEILEGIRLMLLACHRAGRHLNSDYFASEYVNRTELGAIITRLTRIIVNLGIPIPDSPLKMFGTRFHRKLCFIRMMFQTERAKEKNQKLFWSYCLLKQSQSS